MITKRELLQLTVVVFFLVGVDMHIVFRLVRIHVIYY